jgi:tetratricopeptide (TPR) repeat protein
VITQEVVYESLPFRLREQLHEQLAGWIEQTLIQAPPLDILAFHYSRSHNRAKQREYYRRAGDAAAHYYANAAAVRYYTALLELPDLEQRLELELALARVLERTGEWDAAEQHYTAAIALAPDQPNSARALATCAMGSMLWGRGRFAEAEAQLTQARNEYQALGDPAGVVNALTDLAAMYRVQGRFEPAVVVLEEARVLAETTGNRESQTQAYHVLGTVASSMGEYAAARNWMEQEVALCRELGDHWGTAVALNNLGLALLDLGDPHAALPLVREAHTSLREMGVNRAAAISQITLGRVLTALSDRAAARRLFHSSLDVFDQMGVRWEIATATIGLARATWIEGDPLEWLERAVRLCGIAEGIFAGIGAVPQANDAAITAALRAAAELRLGSTISAAIWAGGAAMPFREAIAYIQTDPLR